MKRSVIMTKRSLRWDQVFVFRRNMFLLSVVSMFGSPYLSEML